MNTSLKTHFRMEFFLTIKSLIQQYNYFSLIYLCDAFFTIPLHADSKKFVVFEFENIRICYNVLPFGLTSSPRIFSTMLKPAINCIRSEGIKISSYLNDIFLCYSSISQLHFQINFTLNILFYLGFIPNYKKKSQLIPNTEITHLGY